MRILSIDLDWLFLDCPTYHKRMDTEVDWETSWRVIRAYFPNTEFKPCEESRDFLNHILRNSCKNAKIEIISEHDEIIQFMRDKKCYKAEVINFDMHHDLSYFGDDSKLDIENWVTFGRKENLIGEYTWIHQDNSELSQGCAFKYHRDSWKDLDVSMFDRFEFDHVVICISKHFTPPEYHYLAVDLKGEVLLGGNYV